MKNISDELKGNKELVEMAIFHDTNWGVIKENGKYGAIDRKGNVIAPCVFENGALLAKYIFQNNVIDLILSEVQEMGISIITRDDIAKLSEHRLAEIGNKTLNIDGKRKLSLSGMYSVMTLLFSIKANEYNYPDCIKYTTLWLNEYNTHKMVKKTLFIEGFKALEDYIKNNNNEKGKKSSRFAFIQEFRKNDEEKKSRRK